MRLNRAGNIKIKVCLFSRAKINLICAICKSFA